MSGELTDKITLPPIPVKHDRKSENDKTPENTNNVEIITHSPVYNTPTSSSMAYSHLKWLDYNKMYNIYNEVIRNKFIDSAVRRLWTAICPNQIDIILKQDGIIYRPSDEFSELINYTWGTQMQKALRSIMIVGYYLVTFCAVNKDDDDDDDENERHNGKSTYLVPNVVDPVHYRLWWEYDYNGRRKYGATPIGLPINHNDSNVESPIAEFENYKIFIYDEPTDDGQITSRTRCALTDIMYINQIISDWMIGLNQRANNPIVIQGIGRSEVPSGRVATGLGPGGSAVDNQAAVAIRMSQGLDSRLPPSLSRNAAQADISLNLMRYSASQYAQNRITSDQLEKQIQMLNDRASLTTSRLFDDKRGVMTTGAALLPWQRGLTLKIPQHLQLAHQLDAPEPPKSMPNVVNLLIGLIASELGVPQETILQAVGKDTSVRSNEISNTDFMRSARWWQNNFSRNMTKMYWRIYGIDHIDTVDFNIPVSKMSKTKTIGNSKINRKRVKQPANISIKFSFRNGVMTSAIAEKYYNSHVLNYSALTETLTTEYGISKEMINTEGPIESMRRQNEKDANEEREFQYKTNLMNNRKRVTYSDDSDIHDPMPRYQYRLI